MIFFLVRCFYVTCEIVFFFKMCLREFLIVTALVQPNFCNTDMSSLRAVLLLVSNPVKLKTYLTQTLLPYGHFFWSLTRLQSSLSLKININERSARDDGKKERGESLPFSLSASHHPLRTRCRHSLSRPFRDRLQIIRDDWGWVRFGPKETKLHTRPTSALQTLFCRADTRLFPRVSVLAVLGRSYCIFSLLTK